MAKYNVINNADLSGNIEDNFNVLFEQKNDHKTRFIRSHLNVLRDYASRCKHITEMGVDGVNSTWAFLYGLKSAPSRLVSIDIQNDKAPDILDLAETLAFEAGIDYEFIQSSSLEVTIEKTDLLFIDTLHTYDQLKEELKLHSDSVRRYIACHDTYEYPKMSNALNEFIKDHSDVWSIDYVTTESCGLTIIERKEWMDY